VTVGRATDCTIRSNKKSVSRNHAELRYDNGVCQVVDLDSSNGTYIIVDGERQPVETPRPLSHNDEVWCGDFILYYYESDERHRGAAPPVSDLEPYEGEDARTKEDVRQPQGVSPKSPQPADSGEGTKKVNTLRGGHGANLDGATGPVDAPESEVEELEPEVIDEVDEETYEQLERLREEKESIEDLASRQAVELEEYQQRIDELEQQLAGADESGEDEEVERLERELEEARDEIGELESELQFERNDNDKLAEERDEAERRVDELEDEVAALREQLGERDRRVEELEQENQRLEERRAEAPEAAESFGDSALDDEQRESIGEQIASLEPLVDALGRTDLEELSTVDRVRLQSVMREHEPEATLEQLAELVGIDDSSDREAE
jgi:uncharacterized phage infection (PIP) family protein YhgE